MSKPGAVRDESELKVKASVYLSPKVFKQMKVFCAKRGITQTAYMSTLLEKDLAKADKHGQGS